MPRNVEIKARVGDLAQLRARAQAIADSGPFEIQQDDTFFVCHNGRLKLRTLFGITRRARSFTNAMIHPTPRNRSTSSHRPPLPMNCVRHWLSHWESAVEFANSAPFFSLEEPGFISMKSRGWATSWSLRLYYQTAKRSPRVSRSLAVSCSSRSQQSGPDASSLRRSPRREAMKAMWIRQRRSPDVSADHAPPFTRSKWRQPLLEISEKPWRARWAARLARWASRQVGQARRALRDRARLARGGAQFGAGEHGSVISEADQARVEGRSPRARRGAGRCAHRAVARRRIRPRARCGRRAAGRDR